MTSYDEFKAEALKAPEVRREYEALESKYKAIRKKLMGQLKEADIKHAVIDYLQIGANMGKWIFLRLNSGDFIEVRGETRRRIKGCEKGTPDILVLRSGFVPRFIEIKSPVGKLSPDQKGMKERLETQDCEVYVVRSFEEAQEILEG